MHIDVISSREDLQKLSQNWDDLYQRDPDAHYFVSWTFLSAYLRRYEGAWFILAARPGSRPSPYVALLPLRLRTRMNGKTGYFHNEIDMGGAYAADYNGAVCAPEFAQAAMAAFARHLRKMHWARLNLENIRMSDRRLRTFLKNLGDKRLKMRELSRIDKQDNVDNCRCPSVELPEKWDAYLEQKLSANTRQKLRRLLRKVDGSDKFRITLPDSSTIQRDIDILLEFWRRKWGDRKGVRLPGLLRSNRRMFMDAFAGGSLFLPVLWHRERPLGALATFVDPVRRTFLFNMAGRDETVDLLPAGLVLHGYSIRHAIENGFRTYDFLRGDEPYKYSFGARDTVITCALVRTGSGRNLGDRLDARSLSAVFRQANRFHKAGRLARAESAYRQVLKTDPKHAHALYALGQLLAGKGDHRAAATTFGTLSAIAPHSPKAWARLGIALQALKLHADAADAFQKAVEMRPELAVAQYGLGVSLLQRGEVGEAVSAFNALLRQSSGNSGDNALRIKAALLLERLNHRTRRHLPGLEALRTAAPPPEQSGAVIDARG